MKMFVSLLVLLCLTVAGIAYAKPAAGPTTTNSGNAVVSGFNNFSTTVGTTVASDVYSVAGFRTKTLIATGVYQATGAYGNYSSPVIAQIGPTPTGPWYTAAQQDGTTASLAAPGVLSWDDTAAYVRVIWTKTKHRVKVWFTAQ